MTLAVLALWYTSGVAAAIYAWTLYYDFTTRDVPEILIAGIVGPILAYWTAFPSVGQMRMAWYKEHRPDRVWNPNPYGYKVIIRWQGGRNTNG